MQPVPDTHRQLIDNICSQLWLLITVVAMMTAHQIYVQLRHYATMHHMSRMHLVASSDKGNAVAAFARTEFTLTLHTPLPRVQVSVYHVKICLHLYN